MSVNPRTLDTAGTVFPPRDEWDVAAYDHLEAMAGFMEFNPQEAAPGGNRSPAYRWGWKNRARDQHHQDDGYDHIRRSYIKLRRNAQ